MAAKFVAAIDHGTTSTRCILFDALGSPIATAQRSQTMHFPRPGWVELDMDEVWNRTRECIHEVLRAADAAPADVAAIGITNERESVVLWDRRTDVRSRRIAWQDTLDAAAADAPRRRRRHPPPPGSHRPADLDLPSALKLGWLLDQDGPRGGAGLGDLLFGHRTPGCSGTSPAARRRGARNRSDERMSHPPDEPAHARMGSGLARPLRIPRRCFRDPPFERGVQQGGGRLVRRARRGRPRRPVGVAVRSHVLRPRRHEEHLRQPELSCSPRSEPSR